VHATGSMAENPRKMYCPPHPIRVKNLTRAAKSDRLSRCPMQAVLAESKRVSPDEVTFAHWLYSNRLVVLQSLRFANLSMRIKTVPF